MHRALPLAALFVFGFAVGGRSGEEPDSLVEMGANQAYVFMNISADRTTVYPMQQFTVRLTIAIQELPKPYQDRDPVDVPTDVKLPPPQLRIPWIDGTQIPDGLAPISPWADWLEPLRSKQKSGFRINNVGERSVQTLFENRTVVFRPEPHRLVRPDKNGIERRFWQYEFSRQFLARKVGQYQFGPVTLEGNFAISLDDQERPVTEKVYANADPIRITVQQIPQEGRPKADIGAVGHFQLDAQLMPRHAKVGDLMLLELHLHGKGNLDNAKPPDLTAIPAFSERFRTYGPTQENGPNDVRFMYRLRPLQAGIGTFPAVAVAYFDVSAEKYVILQTAPMPIEVLPAARFSSDQIVASPNSLKAAATEPVAQRAGIFANVTERSVVRDESVGLFSWVAAMTGFATLYMVAAALTFQIRRRAMNAASARRRGAPGGAKRRLRQARAALTEGRTPTAAKLVESAVTEMVADTLGLSQPGLTRNDIRGQLLEHGVPQVVIDDIVQVLEACDAARFGGSEKAFVDMACTLDSTTTRLIQSITKVGRVR